MSIEILKNLLVASGLINVRDAAENTHGLVVVFDSITPSSANLERVADAIQAKVSYGCLSLEIGDDLFFIHLTSKFAKIPRGAVYHIPGPDSIKQ